MFILPTQKKLAINFNGCVAALDIGATKIGYAAVPVVDGKVQSDIKESGRIEAYSSLNEGIKEAVKRARIASSNQLIAVGAFPPGQVDEKTKTIFVTNRPDLGNKGVVYLGDLADEIGKPILFGNDVGKGWGGFVQWGPREATDLRSLRLGEKRSNNFGLLAPGGGLGGCIMQRGEAESAEPGQVPFNHANKEDLRELDRWLGDNPKFNGEPCFEDVACGPGLLNLLEYVYNGLLGEEIPQRFKNLIAEDPNKAIAQIANEARNKQNASCVLAMRLYLQCLGSIAGIMACIGPATGGFFLGGASAKKDLPFFVEHKEDFLKPFQAQRKLCDHNGVNTFIGQMPINVIINENAPTIGAAHSVITELKKLIALGIRTSRFRGK